MTRWQWLKTAAPVFWVPGVGVIARALWVGTPSGVVPADVFWNLGVGVALLLICGELGAVLLWKALQETPVVRRRTVRIAPLFFTALLLLINAAVYLEALDRCGRRGLR